MADRSTYFSHFGTVIEPDNPNPELQSVAETLDGLGDQFRLPEELDWVVLGRRDSVWAVAGFRDGVDDQAVLVVYCQPDGADLEWSEAAVVKWPLQFAEPAQTAASCCAPRFGL